MFPCLPLSPSTYFPLERTVGIDNAGAVFAPNISFFSSLVTTVIEGATLFISWPATAKNLQTMARANLKSMTWEAVLPLMRELEQPRFNNVTKGQSIYKAPGEAHMTLSTKPSAVYCFEVANPSPAEWNNTLAAYDAALEAYKSIPDSETEDLENAIADLQSGLKIWRKVKELISESEEEDEKTISRQQLIAFIAKQEKGLKEMRARKRRRQGGQWYSLS